jgi:hypothetical protein
MRSRSGQLAFSTTAAAVLSGLLVLGSADAALAQGKPAKPAAPAAKPAAKPAAPAAKPAAPAAKPAGDAAVKPGGATSAAKPAAGGAAKPAAAKPKLTEKQKKDQAKKLFGEAKEKFEKGDYAGALPLYEQADELVPGARPKYQAAVCLDKTGQVVDAVAWYQKFLDGNPDADKYKAEIPDAKARIDALKATPAKVVIATDPPGVQGLKLTVDGAAQPGAELSVPPGKHTIVATATGYDSATQPVEVTFAEKKDLTIKLAKSAAPVVAAAPPPAPPPPAAKPVPATSAAAAAPPPAAKPRRSRIPAYVTLGLAGAGAVVGTVFGVQALSAKSDFNKSPTSDLADKADRNALISDMSFAVALTFGVTGAVLLLSGGGDEKAAAPPAAAPPPKKTSYVPTITPFVGPKAGGAAAMLQF